MKKRLYVAAAAAVGLATCVATSGASASTITFTQNQVTVPADFITTPTMTSGNYTVTSGSNNYQSSPFPNQISPYSCLSCGTPAVAGTATYDLPVGSTGFSIFWGSPDSYNSIEFFDGGTLLDTVTGTDLNPPAGSGHNLVDFSFNGQTVTSVVLADNGTQAFEYSDVSLTPIPAALPLFMGGLGLIGLLTRRRKRQVSGAIVAA